MFVKFITDISNKETTYIKRLLFLHTGIIEHSNYSFEIHYTKNKPQTEKPFIWIKRGKISDTQINWEIIADTSPPYAYISHDIPTIFLKNLQKTIDGELPKHSEPLWDIFINGLKKSLIKLSQISNNPIMIIEKYPAGFLFGGIMGHDIDLMRKWGFRKIMKNPKTIKELFKELSGKNDYYTFSDILDIEQKANIVSSFYFMSKNKDLYTHRYKLEKYLLLLEELQENNNEIGIHITRDWKNNYGEISYQIKRFKHLTNLKPYGTRFHYLKYNKTALQIIEQNGLFYDASVGTNNGIHFPALTSHPYPIYEMNHLWEIPFSLMDAYVMGKTYRETIDIFRKNAQIAMKNNSIFHILIHQHSYDTSEFPYIKPAIEDFLAEYNSKIFWQTTADYVRRFKALDTLFVKKYLSNDKKNLLILNSAEGIKDLLIYIYDIKSSWKNISITLSGYGTYMPSIKAWKIDIPILTPNSPIHITMDKR